MSKKRNFVFFSKRRWKIVKISILVFAILLILPIFTVVVAFTKSPFKNNFSKAEILKIVDQIATRSPNEIRVFGEGPILNLANVSDQYFLQKTGQQGQKLAFLTFDDGPDPVYTRQILDILNKENIKATFFAVGENIYKNPQIAREIIKNGHLLGVHTFTHAPEGKDLYKKDSQMFLEFELTQRLIQETTGYSSQIFRLPYWGSEKTIDMNNLVLTVNAAARGYKNIGSTVDSLDWQAKSVDEILENIKNQPQDLAVILLHDGGGNRANTIAALPQIISYYRSQGYQFAKADRLFHSEEILTPVNWQEMIFAKSAVGVYSFFRNFPSLEALIYLFGLGAFAIHSIFISIFAVLHKVQRKHHRKFSKTFYPKVSVVIPAYNEEKVIVKTLRSVLRSNYKNIEVIVVNDGSTDNTDAKLYKFLKNPKVKLIWQPSQGKFAALNSGFDVAAGEIVVTIDADTQILPKTIGKLVRHFEASRLGAICGNVKVANRQNWLTLLQELDYRMAINLERRAFDFLNSVFVVPGAIGAWRKKAVERAGRFSSATLTEDAELGLRLKKAGYKIIYEPEAIGLTEAPASIAGLLRQRFRWTFGMLQTLWLHKDMNLNPEYGILGMLVLPYTVFIQLPSMAIAPVIELSAIPLAFFVSAKLVFFTLFALLAIRFLLFLLASKLSGEDFSLFPLILPYRFIYQFLWYFVLDVAVYTALKGPFVSWQKLPHFGVFEKANYSKPWLFFVPQVKTVANE